MALIFTDQTILRSIFHAIREVVVGEGYLPDEKLYTDSPQDTAQWFIDKNTVKTTKGFFIDVFSESSARNKRMKDSVRIVLFLSRVYDGEIGAPARIISTQNVGAAKKYKAGFGPSKAANLIFAVHLIGSTSQQSYVLNAIISNALGTRSFIKRYDNPTELIFINQTSFGDLDNPMENLFEKVYYYTVPDIFLGDIRDGGDISEIKEITVEEEDRDNNHLDTIKVE